MDLKTTKAPTENDTSPHISPSSIAFTTTSNKTPGEHLQKFETEHIERLKTEEFLSDARKERNLVMKQDLRILLPSVVIFLLSFLDRTNVANARVLNQATGDSLLQTLHFTNHEFVVSLMLFLVAYAAFEAPSNLMLKRFHPSRWIAFLMMTWGILTMTLAAVESYAAFTIVRVLLGAAEAGLFPGLVFILTFWYKTNERILRIALIFASGCAAGAFGGAIAYGIGHLNGRNGLEGWRWLFILEGMPSCVMRALAVARLIGDASSSNSKITWQDIKQTLTEWRLSFHYLIYLCVSIPFGSLALFSPSIVAGLGCEGLQAQLFTVPPYACAYAVTVAVAVSAERTGARSLHTFFSMLIASVAFLVQALLPATSFQARYAVFCIAASGAFASVPPLLGWLTSNLRSTTAAGLAVGLNLSFSGIGQMIGTVCSI